MSWSCVHAWSLVPARLAGRAANTNAEAVALMNAADQANEGGGRIFISSRGGFVDRGLDAFIGAAGASALRALIEPHDPEPEAYRVYAGDEVRRVYEDLVKVLEWSASNPEAVDEALEWGNVGEVEDAMASQGVSDQPSLDEEVPFREDGNGPWVLFTYLRTLRQLFERAREEGGAMLQYRGSA